MLAFDSLIAVLCNGMQKPAGCGSVLSIITQSSTLTVLFVMNTFVWNDWLSCQHWLLVLDAKRPIKGTRHIVALQFPWKKIKWDWPESCLQWQQSSTLAVLRWQLNCSISANVRTIHLIYHDEWGRVEVSGYDPPSVIRLITESIQVQRPWITTWLFYYTLCIFSLYMLQTLAEYQESGEQFVLSFSLLMFNKAAAWQSETPQMLLHLLVCVHFVFMCAPQVGKGKYWDLEDNSHSILCWILHKASTCSKAEPILAYKTKRSQYYFFLWWKI